MTKVDQVIGLIRRSIDLGVYKKGEYLPSIRNMAGIVGVGINTVYLAYCRLEKEGLVTAVEYRGFQVIDVGKASASDDRTQTLTQLLTMTDLQYSHLVNSADTSKVLIGSVQAQSPSFPSDGLSLHFARYIRSHADEINRYRYRSQLTGEPSRIGEETVKFMQQQCATSVSKEELIFTNGATSGLLDVMRTLTRPGDTIVIEAPCHIGTLRNKTFLGLKSAPILSVSPDGFDVEEFQRRLDLDPAPACLVIIPNFSNPSGYTMPDENKRRVAELCREREIPIIEDGVQDSLYFTKNPPLTMKSIMPDDVIYVGSYTKNLAPGYWVGWIAGGKYTEDIRHTVTESSFVSPTMQQEAIASYLKTENITSYMRKYRKGLYENCRRMLELTQRHLPEGTVVHAPSGGQFLWVQFPQQVDCSALYSICLEENILIAAGNLFADGNEFRNCMRLNYSMSIDKNIEETMKKIGTIASEQL